MPSKMVGSKREFEVNDCTSIEKGLKMTLRQRRKSESRSCIRLLKAKNI
jgi:hypothetical protein